MKKLVISLVMVLMMAGVCSALEMPDMSINAAFLYSLETKTVEVAPAIDMTLVTAFDGVLRGNVTAVFPKSDGVSTQGNFMGGPMIKVDFVKLLAKNSHITIIKNFQLEAGLGVMFDVFHINGMTGDDLNKIIYPTMSVGFRF